MPWFDKWSDTIPFVVFALFILVFIVNIVRRGGFKAAMFNATIRSTLGEVKANGPKLMSQQLTVHALMRDGEKLVGIEIVSKSAMSYEMLPVVFSQAQARALASLLQEGALYGK